MMPAPASAPASGRANNRTRGDFRPIRSSRRGGGAASMVSLMEFLQTAGPGAAGAPAAPWTARSLPRAPLGVLRHLGDIGGVDERRAGQRGLAATEDVAVGFPQPQRVDGLI